jgi:hypothetical protein
MRIAHVVIQEAVTHFLANQPINKLINQLFRGGKQVQDDFEPIKQVSCLMFKDGVGTMRLHWNDVVPRALQDIEKTEDLDTIFTISVKGLEAEIFVSYDKSSMWFNITSKTFDNLFALAVERSKE